MNSVCTFHIKRKQQKSTTYILIYIKILLCKYYVVKQIFFVNIVQAQNETLKKQYATTKIYTNYSTKSKMCKKTCFPFPKC